jgi:hypothetical protein
MVALATAGCARSVNLEQERNTVLARDREWAQSTKDADKFMSYVAQDATVYAPGEPAAKGAATIRTKFEEMSRVSGVSFTWTLDKADVAKSQDSTSTFPDGDYMIEAVDRVVATADEATRMFRNVSWYAGTSVAASFVNPGRGASLRLPLRSDETYAFVGAGDDDAADVDIILRDHRGDVVAYDEDVDATPFLVYRPRRSGDYTLTLELHAARVRSFVALAILTDGTGYSVPLSSMATALRGSLMQAEVVARAQPGTHYHHQDNHWAILGQVLPQGGSMQITNLTMEDEQHVIVAAGDAAAQDLDIFVRKAGRLIASNEDPEALPWVIVRTRAASDYEVEVRNVRSSGPTLVVMSMIE